MNVAPVPGGSSDETISENGGEPESRPKPEPTPPHEATAEAASAHHTPPIPATRPVLQPTRFAERLFILLGVLTAGPLIQDTQLMCGWIAAWLPSWITLYFLRREAIQGRGQIQT